MHIRKRIWQVFDAVLILPLLVFLATSQAADSLYIVGGGGGSGGGVSLGFGGSGGGGGIGTDIGGGGIGGDIGTNYYNGFGGAGGENGRWGKGGDGSVPGSIGGVSGSWQWEHGHAGDVASQNGMLVGGGGGGGGSEAARGGNGGGDGGGRGGGYTKKAAPGVPASGGGGGGGGQAHYIIPDEDREYSGLAIIGGEGGAGGSPEWYGGSHPYAGGGGGGGANLSIRNIVISGAEGVEIHGGNGGANQHDIRVVGDRDGSGGTYGLGGNTGGGGGGGGAYLKAKSIELTNPNATLSMKSGGGRTTWWGDYGSGGGGEARIEADTLIAANIHLQRQKGQLAFSVGDLDMRHALWNTTNILLDGTVSGLNGVNIDNLVFGSNHTLRIRTENLAHSIDSNIVVYGSGNVLDTNFIWPKLAGKTATFYLAPDIKPSSIMLRVLQVPLDVSGGTLNVVAPNGIANLQDGDKIVFISGSWNETGQDTILVEGGLFDYSFLLDQSNGSIVGKFTGSSLNEYKSKPFAESGIGSLSGLVLSQNRVVRFLDMQLLPDSFSSSRTAHISPSSVPSLSTFADIGFDTVRSQSGSHVDSDYFSGFVGIAVFQNAGIGRAWTGLFIEGGKGNYDTYNTFSADSIYGDGNAKHLGTGLMFKYAHSKGFGVDLSLRVGKVWNDYRNSEISPGIIISYDANNIYWGTHFGLSQSFELNNDAKVGIFGKLLYTYISSGDCSLSNGNSLSFGTMNSIRSNFGGYYSKRIKNNLTAYTSLAWEYEFDGKVNSKISTNQIESPSLRGSTGIIGIGLTWQSKKRWEAGISLQGMLGKRQGIGGTFGVGYTF